MWRAIEDRVRNYRVIDDNYLSNRPPYDRPNYVEVNKFRLTIPAAKR